MVTDSGQIVVREQWDHPYKEGSSLFRFHISVANIVQSSVYNHGCRPWAGVGRFHRTTNDRTTISVSCVVPCALACMRL